MKQIILLFRGISSLYKTEPIVALLVCLSLTASAFAMFFFFGFSESMADYTRETFEAEQCCYGFHFGNTVVQNEIKDFIRRLPIDTKNILYISTLGDLEIRSTDCYDTLETNTPYLVWVEKGSSTSPAQGEIFANYHQLVFNRVS